MVDYASKNLGVANTAVFVYNAGLFDSNGVLSAAPIPPNPAGRFGFTARAQLAWFQFAPPPGSFSVTVVDSLGNRYDSSGIDLAALPQAPTFQMFSMTFVAASAGDPNLSTIWIRCGNPGGSVPNSFCLCSFVGVTSS